MPKTNMETAYGQRRTTDEGNSILPKMMAYHQSGTCLYLAIKRAWTSGCSWMERRAWVQICLR